MLSSLIYPSNIFIPTISSPLIFSKSCNRFPVNNSAISKRNFQLPVAHVSSNSISIPSSGTNDNHDNFWLHEFELDVRDYELDQYGVVDDATYANYCQHSLAKALEKVSREGGDIGGAVALLNLSLNFITPLRKGDKFLVKQRVTKWSRTRLFVEHCIVKLHEQEGNVVNLSPIMREGATTIFKVECSRKLGYPEPIMKASATAIWIDEMYRPQRIPPDVISYIVKMYKVS